MAKCKECGYTRAVMLQAVEERARFENINRGQAILIKMLTTELLRLQAIEKQYAKLWFQGRTPDTGPFVRP